MKQAAVIALLVVLASAAIVSLVAAFLERQTRTSIRWQAALMAPTLAMLIASFALNLGVGAAVVSTLSFLAALEAWALTVGTPPSLQAHARLLDRDGPEKWWARFEREFRASFDRPAQNPLQSAVARQRRKTDAPLRDG